MNRVGEFEKVSFEQFEKAVNSIGIPTEGFVQACYDAIVIPQRATSGSMGFDFKSPFDFELSAGQTIKIPTGIRVRIDDGWGLAVFPRSSLGFKYRIQLDNTVGIIDSDYYYSNNEGHIFIKITNDNKKNKTLSLKAGDGFAQGIFLQYGITYSDNAQGVRNGGIGSTGK